MAEKILVKAGIREKFEAFLHGQRVLFFSAPCGFGKTCVAEALLAGRQVLRLDGGKLNAGNLPAEEKGTVLIEDFQNVQEEGTVLALCESIRVSPDRRFVILSRGAPPGCMMSFQYAGIMTVISYEELLFTREDILDFFTLNGGAVTAVEADTILEKSGAFPLGVAITARLLSTGLPYDEVLAARAFQEVFRYFETAIFLRFDLPVRRFLMELSIFDSFDAELAKMVSGDLRARERLDWLQRNTSMLLSIGVERFRFWPGFREFLLWELDRSFSEDKRRALFDRGGMYYELKGTYPQALECYSRAGDHNKLSELLVRNAELHPGMGHYCEMEKYYRALPEQEILESPALMQGMSMLCALDMDYEGSERWYRELKDFAQSRDRQDGAGRQARGRLAWLDISLPQRGVEGLTETIPAVARLLTQKELTVPPFSVTSALPSIMNGGKDFSTWSKRDDLLYATVRVPVEKLLGPDGVGLPDCAMAESKFEKGEDISQRLLTVVSRMSEIQRRGTPDMEFAACGLLARSYVTQGRPDNARRTLELLRQRLVEKNETRFLPNLDAMLCRVDLQSGDLERADRWYREKAPRNPVQINVMKRYQYFTQAMVELAGGEPENAMLTVAPLEDYCKSCKRYIDFIHLQVLMAISMYRLQQEGWKDRLHQALETAREFQFIRTVSVYGAGVLPLLSELEMGKDDKWFKRLLAETRRQNACAPLFLQPRLTRENALTATEKQILRLVCADKSNAEIAQIMNIKLTTVKTHVSHILEKLDVSRRSEAKTAAKRLKLVPEDL